jgi:cyclophilin family peptidyl-prolyl cis-trans isomerase
MSGVKDVLKDNKKILLLVVGLLLACVFGLYLTKSGGLLSTNSDLTNLTTRATYTRAEQVMEANTDYKAVLKTSVGDITIDLLEKETPLTVNSFLFLAGKRFYEDMIFHRVIKNFVIQTGDPTGTGTGGPGYYVKNEITERKYAPYVVGMANSGADTNGSQFFITSGNIPKENSEYMDGKYTIFGIVTKGFAVVDSIEKVETDKNDKPVNSVKLISVQILEN